MTLDTKSAAALIWRLWQSGEVASAFPAGQKPATRKEGYAIQAHLEGYSSKPRYGWKIAATSAAGQKHIGVDGPIAGRLLAERISAPGSKVSITTNRMRVCEPEFAFAFAHDVTPRNTPYTQAEVMGAVADLHLALELPDSRFADFATVGGPSLIADNACARDFVIGPRVTYDWRSLDLSKHKVHAKVGSRYERDGVGANVYGDPRIALTWLVNEVTGLGITLKRGEIVPTGICMVPLAIEPGDHVVADFGALGTISVSVA